jgi:DNA helicase-2/ATP-dependent DNA helicase PcrA
LSFERIVNLSKKGVGRKTLDKIRALAQEKSLPILEVLNFTEEIAGLGQKSRATLEEFYGMLKYFATLNDHGVPLADLLDTVLEATSYKEMLMKNDHLEAETRLENINELRSLALEFEQSNGSGLEEFLAGTVLVQESDDVDDSDLILMMTFHGAKGLEFSHVFMSGME